MPDLNTGRAERKVHLTSSQQHFIENMKHVNVALLNAVHVLLFPVIFLGY